MLISSTTGTTTGIGTGVAGGVVLSILTILGIRLVFTLTEQVLWWWKWFLRLNGMTIKVNVVWTGIADGLLQGSNSFVLNRVESQIDQCFIQSPYLKKATTPNK